MHQSDSFSKSLIGLLQLLSGSLNVPHKPNPCNTIYPRPKNKSFLRYIGGEAMTYSTECAGGYTGTLTVNLPTIKVNILAKNAM